MLKKKEKLKYTLKRDITQSPHETWGALGKNIKRHKNLVQTLETITSCERMQKIRVMMSCFAPFTTAFFSAALMDDKEISIGENVDVSAFKVRTITIRDTKTLSILENGFKDLPLSENASFLPYNWLAEHPNSKFPYYSKSEFYEIKSNKVKIMREIIKNSPDFCIKFFSEK